MDVDVCAVGGGPAGMVLGLLLALAGLHATVLEKHADFLRDFRGDTVHPSTLDVLAARGTPRRRRRCHTARWTSSGRLSPTGRTASPT
jgi:2-polyprenyl-6-methoxyphenol hydroxylase-like FAD-dependent oxidoreductase